MIRHIIVQDNIIIGVMDSISDTSDGDTIFKSTKGEIGDTYSKGKVTANKIKFSKKVKKDFDAIIEEYLQSFATKYNYVSIMDMISYVNDPFQKYKDDAILAISYRSRVRQLYENLIINVDSGEPVPTINEFRIALDSIN